MRPLLLLLILTVSPAVAAELPTTDEAEAVARLQAIRAYKARRLQVRAYSELTGGGSSMSPGLGLGGVQISSDPIRTVHTWGLFQGPSRLSLPEFYEMTGDSAAGQDLKLRVQRYRKTSAVAYGVGVAGVVTGAIGLVGLGRATSPSQQQSSLTTLAVGAVIAAVGLSAGGIPGGRADRLEMDPSYSLKPLEAQSLADDYNERLRVALSLSAEDAALIELGHSSTE